MFNQQTNGQTSVYERAPWQQASGPIFVRFYAYEDYNRARSVAEGRPIIDVKDYIEFPRAGEIDILRRQATEGDKQAHPDAWRAYKESREQMPSGTPVATLFPAHPEIISLLRHFRVHTVEQLAEISDTAVQQIGLGGHEWRARAQELIKASEGSQGFHQLKKQVDDRDATIAKMQQQLAMMEARIAAPGPTGASSPGVTPHTQQVDMATMQAMVAQAVASAALSSRPPRGKTVNQTEAGRLKQLENLAKARAARHPQQSINEMTADIVVAPKGGE